LEKKQILPLLRSLKKGKLKFVIMNISQALKQKSKIIRDIKTQRNRLQTWNTYTLGSTVPYEAKETYEKWLELKEELIQLKSKIQKANNGIMDKIFRLSELKDTIDNLQNLMCIEGEEVRERYSMRTVEVSGISLLERDELIKKLENEIDEIQNEIEIYNHKTLI
jgi:hypothetical protein